MEKLTGKPVSPGYAEGVAFVFDAERNADVPKYAINDSEVAAEHHRFHEAVQRSLRDLKQLEARVMGELGQAQSAIFSAHLGLLQDAAFAGRVKERISRDLVNVEHALKAEVDNLCKLLASVESKYVRERAQDIRDIGKRVMQQLVGHNLGQYSHLPSGSVIVARELLPSETIDLDRRNVVGIVTEEGGENSHAAILARALAIPAVTGVNDATSRIASGVALLVNGETGSVTIKPNRAAVADFSQLKSHYDEEIVAVAAAESLDCVTLDGTRISLLANLNRPNEAALVGEHHLDGVGLFRSEFLFLEATSPPTVQQQLPVYRQVIESLGNGLLVMRTMDLGGDKLPAFLTPHHESNPSLGLRGLRFALAERTLFEAQVSAILQATAGRKNVRLLLPMVLGESDFAEGVSLVRAVEDDLKLDSRVFIGAMIETPSALFALEGILRLADFISIGTNDLTQFMLAADRDAFELVDDYSVMHPSVLRAIAKVIAAGRDAGREVCICGEAAGYARLASLLVGLGARQLSMSPVRSPRVRYSLRSFELTELEKLAQQALTSNSTAAVRQLLLDFEPRRS